MKLRPDYTDARMNLARVYMKTANYKKGIDQLKIATEDLTYPKPSKPLYYLGQGYFLRKQYVLASENFKKSIEFNAKSCLAYLFYGKTSLKLNRVNIALKAFKAAESICLGTEKAESIYYVGFTHLLNGETLESKKYLKILKSKHPQSHFLKRLQDKFRN